VTISNTIQSQFHSTALHCTALPTQHCISLNCTAWKAIRPDAATSPTWPAPLPFALHCTALHCTALHCTVDCLAWHGLVRSTEQAAPGATCRQYAEAASKLQRSAVLAYCSAVQLWLTVVQWWLTVSQCNAVQWWLTVVQCSAVQWPTALHCDSQVG
jgi:hypothetical protein